MNLNTYRKSFLLTAVLIFCGSFLFSQSRFFFEERHETKDKLRFELVKNLMIVPITINGVELSFLLDTGVEKTILFSLDQGDSLELKDAVSIELRGLGRGESMLAFKSENNRAKIGKAISRDLSLFVIFSEEMNLSKLLGLPVNGIIGYDFFKNFIVEVNYQREFIKFYDPLVYDQKCRNCDSEPLFFYNQKPYVKTSAIVNGEPANLTLLIDSGASDALWLYTKNGIEVPPNYFEDFLGLGLSGHIYGKRSKIGSFSMGKFEFENIATAFPDSLAFAHFGDRILKDGLIGSGILKRFDLVIDYPNGRILFKPNRFFDEPFYYNMSGLVVQYRGVQVIKDYVNIGKFNQGIRLESENDFKKKLFKVRFKVIPQMEIVEVRPGSPSYTAGFKKGDILLEINGKGSHHFTLLELTQLFSSKEGKRIKIKIDRNGMEITKTFHLEKML